MQFKEKCYSHCIGYQLNWSKKKIKKKAQKFPNDIFNSRQIHF